MFCKNCGKSIKVTSSFCKECGTPSPRNIIGWFKEHKKTLIILIIFLGFIMWVNSNSETDLDSLSEKSSNNISTAKYVQSEITASVVNILCPGLEDDLSDATGGSGTIISSDGIVLTNSHIIPQDREENVIPELCLVVLPNPVTGEPSEFYTGVPYVVPFLSSKYDIAAIILNGPYVDDDGVAHGNYSKIFPAFDDSDRCSEGEVSLGEPIRIFGYPSLSGGYSLTITDGIVSSFPGEGLIITSAKISNGNSGGLAIDQYGCMIGIPSMVSSDENESLGVIISNNLIGEFVDKMEALNKLLD